MDTHFSGWREGMRHYLPWFAVAVMVTAAGAAMGCVWAGIPFWILAVCATLFFRDFSRRIALEASAVLSPADGTVVGVEKIEQTPHYEGPALCVSIFMSVFNVHVNRAPCDCRVHDIRYAPGAYKNAMKAEASRVNESNALWLDTDHGPITVRQISGAVARRIVCRTAPGKILKQGEKFGMIKFGSRVEVYLPQTAAAMVKPGDKPRAGLTVLARFQ